MTIFDQTYAVFSPKFREEFYNFPNDAMFQRICDCVGVVYVHEDNNDKLLGSWESVKKAHDVLTAYLFLKSLSTPMTFSGKLEKTTFSTNMSLDSTNEKRPSPSATGTRVSFGSAPTGLNMNSEGFYKDYMQIEEGDESFDLDPHYKAELGKVKPQYDDEGRVVYNCDICSYFGHKRHNLVVHKIRTHIRPYKCGKCSRGFGLRKDLRRHHNNKRNCSSYGKDYKRHCGEGRLRLQDIRFLNLDDASQQEANSTNWANLTENASKEDTDSSTLPGKDIENTLNATESNLIHKRDKHSNGAAIFNTDNPTALDKEQCNSEFEDNKTSHQHREDLLSSGIDKEQIFVKAEPVEFTVSQANENHCNSSTISSEPWTKTTSHKQPSNSEDMEGAQFRCAICNFSSPKKQQVDDHTKRVHCKIFECSICGSMFGMKKDLNRHYRRTHRIHFKCRGKETHGYAA